MNSIIHERPGVYSSYDAAASLRGGRAVRVIGAAAKSKTGTPNTPVTITSYEMGVSVFGEDAAGAPGMSTLLKLLFLGGAAMVSAVAVSGDDYASAFAALQGVENVQIVVCDSGDLAVQQALRSSLETASAARRERIAVVGMSGADTAGLTARAKELNSERMVLVGPDALDSNGKPLPGIFAAAAVAAAVAVTKDPAIPLNGTNLYGLGGVSQQYSDNEIDLLVRNGVTPLEAVGGVVSPVRGITTRTTTGGAADTTWRELTTILIVDDVIPSIRQSLRSRFSQAKNTGQTRGAIRSQVIVELESKLRAEIIDGYSDVTVSVYDDDPTVCLVEFSFSVAHGLNQIYLTAHITI
ncbi:MAG: phage tail sheath subtilisin-like domain-containing protein [Oscillospiraceae bacterium]|nr:phage tail sheath subtilisin-like domain-containing protein [Oscillospiraceae bacterium]